MKMIQILIGSLEEDSKQQRHDETFLPDGNPLTYNFHEEEIEKQKNVIKLDKHQQLLSKGNLDPKFEVN